jgi:hypothetical protein
MDQQALGEWAREQFQRAARHLAENGIIFESVFTEDSRYLAPYVAIWKIKATDGKRFWVISGDLPSDFAGLQTAENAREALRYFAMSWQMKAENLRATVAADQEQMAYAKLLEEKAELLHSASSQEQYWGGSV